MRRKPRATSVMASLIAGMNYAILLLHGRGYEALRVTLLSQDFYDYSLELANALSQKAEVLLIQPENWTGQFPFLISDSLKVKYLPEYRPRDPRGLLGAATAVKWIKDFKPDVLHFNGVSHWFIPWFSSLKARYPIVSTIHEPSLYPQGNKGKFILLVQEITRNRNIRCSDQIIVHGMKLKTIIGGRYRLGEDRVWSIPHGSLVLFRKWEGADITEEDASILMFGNITRRNKGLEYLLRAVPLIAEKVPALKVVLAGAGNMRPYEHLIQDKKRFIIHDEFIPSEKVAALFQKASVVVFPYLYGAQSGVLSIAIGFGKPVVITDVGSFPEVVEDGKTGFVVPPRHPEKLADAVTKILLDKEMRVNMGKNALRLAETELSWSRVADKTMEVYEKALESR